MSYLCRNGHNRPTPEAAANCSACKSNDTRRAKHASQKPNPISDYLNFMARGAR